MYIPIGTCQYQLMVYPDTMTISGYLIYGRAITDIICSLVEHVYYNLNCAPSFVVVVVVAFIVVVL